MMERLTTNKCVSEMNMVELAYNSCYGKDGWARYRDFELDIDARELARKLLKDFADGDDAFTSDEDFEEQLLDYMQYGTDTMEGLIAVFYRNLWAMADLRGKLKEYEDAEEQGLFLRLPCKEGDTVWELCKCYDGIYRIFPMVVKQVIPHGAIRWVKGKEPSVWNIYAQSDYTDMYKRFYDIGKTVFLTKEEAQQALKQMGE